MDRDSGYSVKVMIVQKLVERRDRSEIVQAVCEHTGLDWPRAEELVQRVEVEQAHAVARGQLPILVFLSAAIAGGGLLLLGFSIQTIWSVAVQGDLLAFVFTMAGGSSTMWVGILGLAMIAGGIIGMWKTMLRFFET